ncbi:hypothetical protein WT63_08835 [Burkholderia anthina]|nr:hypothetical protein WT63_08835 [Burkholderia anthina]
MRVVFGGRCRWPVGTSDTRVCTVPMPSGEPPGSTIRQPDHAAYDELDTPATLLYCSAQFAPDRRVPASSAPWLHGGAT